MFYGGRCVSLFVRLWVEIINVLDKIKKEICQPLREAVSWNSHPTILWLHGFRQPLREAVSWNITKYYKTGIGQVSLFVRLWVEIEIPVDEKTLRRVSLFVRLWVEILKTVIMAKLMESASSWGCELKLFLQKIRLPVKVCQPLREAVSWNVSVRCSFGVNNSQPLREAVSWNVQKQLSAASGDLSASSWGCELKYLICENSSWENLSASSWGCELKFLKIIQISIAFLSASSWGCELKCFAHCCFSFLCRQPLREAVSWNATTPAALEVLPSSASSWGCELKYKVTDETQSRYDVSLFVRLWVEI